MSSDRGYTPSVHQYTISGQGTAASYQKSGLPWITGSGPGHGEGLTGLAGISKGIDNGASSSFQAGMFLIDGEGTAAAPAEVYIKFPYVTKSFQVIQSGSGILRIHFRAMHEDALNVSNITGSSVIRGQHYIQLDGDEESFKFNIRTKEVYISTVDQTAGFQLFAELTTVGTGSFPALSGSGITE